MLNVQVLIYPATDLSSERASFEQFKDGFLPRENARWYKSKYTPRAETRLEPSASPLLAPTDTLRRTAPAYVALARCDVLHDEGLAYAEALKKAGVSVVVDVTEGAPHGFFSLQGLAEAQSALSRVCAWLEGQWTRPASSHSRAAIMVAKL